MLLKQGHMLLMLTAAHCIGVLINGEKNNLYFTLPLAGQYKILVKTSELAQVFTWLPHLEAVVVVV